MWGARVGLSGISLRRFESSQFRDMERKSMGFLQGYLLITSGPRHVADITSEPAARAQMNTLRYAADRHRAQVDIVGWDYARKIRSLDDIPCLVDLLKRRAGNAGTSVSQPHLVLDDYNRLFRATTSQARRDVVQLLWQHADVLRDVRTGQPFNDLSERFRYRLISERLAPLGLGKKPVQRSEAMRQQQTSAARETSIKARGKAARDAAVRLQAAYLQFQQRTPGGSLKAFIESDASNEVVNSWGKPWSYRGAARALRQVSVGKDQI
ncbi:hypothetical protein MGEO_03520 [Marivita geojedonensis]|uniref:Uncharacterized protein n=1 Tax=Marivita geojedonensis TaxID=1123756 RepID=A0A1X4NP30_9RHOB|nr:hypothetical protein MGEO_03520 [Marivita geojedonensis]